MPFSPSTRQDALFRSRRYCCVCREFAGRNVEVHHILPESEGGSDDISNAIVVCFNCHADVGHYNPNHPRGTKYLPEELVKYRDEWWEWCESNPAKTPPKSPILVSPNEIALQTGFWRGKSELKVTNRSQQTFFAIRIKMGFLSNRYTAKDLELRGDPGEGAITGKVGNYNFGADVCLYGTDGKGMKALYLVLYSLDANTTRTFILTSKLKNQHPDIKIRLTFTVLDFSEDPSPFLQGDNKMALQMIPPEEGVVIHEIGILNL